MTLYELTNEYQILLDMAEDPDVDPVVLFDTMDAVGGEIEMKADGYAKVIRQLEADVEGLKTEENRISRRRKTIENNIKFMKNRLTDSMIATGKTKFKTELFSFNVQKNPAKLVMDEQYIENIPVHYLIEQEPKVNTSLLKDDLKAGVDLEGIAHLEQDMGVRIR